MSKYGSRKRIVTFTGAFRDGRGGSDDRRSAKAKEWIAELPGGYVHVRSGWFLQRRYQL